MSEIAHRGLTFSRSLRRPVILGGLALVLFVAFLVSLVTGAVPVRVADVLRALTGLQVDMQTAAVIQMLRLPRALLVILVGGALAGAGAALQGLFRNPLADPSLIGVSSGAALGAVTAIVLGSLIGAALPFVQSPFLLPVAAFLGGLGATFTMQRLAQSRGRAATASLLLAGIAINALAGALTGFLVYLSNDTQLRDFTFWSMGSLAGASWTTLTAVSVPILISLAVVVACARPLDAMLLGEREALHLGVRVERLKNIVMVAGALAVSAAVAVSGVIAFVGIVVPHILRMIAGPDHRVVLPGSIIAGATLLLVADSFARVAVAPAELPIGLVTSAIGSPFFLWLLLRGRGAQ